MDCCYHAAEAAYSEGKCAAEYVAKEKEEELIPMFLGVLNGTITPCTAKTWLKLNYPEYMAGEAGVSERV